MHQSRSIIPRSRSATSTAPKIILVANTSGTQYERMVLGRDEELDLRELLSLSNAGRSFLPARPRPGGTT